LNLMFNEKEKWLVWNLKLYLIGLKMIISSLIK